MSRGYMYLALRGLETELREMADDDGIVLLSNRSIASKLQIGLRQLNEMITELVEEGLVYKTRGLVKVKCSVKASNGSVKDQFGSVKESNGSVTDARHEEIKDSKTLRDHESLRISKNEKNNGNVVADKPRQRTHISADQKRKKRNDELTKVYADPFFRWLWERYPHNEATSGMDRKNCAGWFLDNISKLENNEKHARVTKIGEYFKRYRQWLEKVNGKPVAMHKALTHDQIPVGWNPED